MKAASSVLVNSAAKNIETSIRVSPLLDGITRGDLPSPVSPPSDATAVLTCVRVNYDDNNDDDDVCLWSGDR